jgi:hypothetical protein
MTGHHRRLRAGSEISPRFRAQIVVGCDCRYRSDAGQGPQADECPKDPAAATGVKILQIILHTWRLGILALPLWARLVGISASIKGAINKKSWFMDIRPRSGPSLLSFWVVDNYRQGPHRKPSCPGKLM